MDTQTPHDEFDYMQIHPEQYILQTLDDAALVLTVCNMAMEKVSNPLPSELEEMKTRIVKVWQMLSDIDKEVNKHYNMPVVTIQPLED